MDALHNGMLIGMPTTQIAVRVPDELLERIDRLVVGEQVESRADAVRQGLEYVVAVAERHRIDLEIVEAYQRTPPAQEDEALAEAALRASIQEEPW